MASGGQDGDQKPGRGFQEIEDAKGGEGGKGVGGVVDAFSDDRTVKGSQKEANDGGVCAFESRLGPVPGAQAVPEGESPSNEEPGWEEDGKEAPDACGPGVWPGMGEGAKVSREGKEGTGHGLNHAVAGKKLVLGDPARRDDGGPQQREGDMTTAEDERADPVETVEENGRFALAVRGGEGENDEQSEECGQSDGGPEMGTGGRGFRVEGLGWDRVATVEKPAGEGADGDGDNLSPGGGDECEKGRCGDGEEEAGAVGAEAFSHGEYGMCDDGDGGEFQPAQPAGVGGIAQRRDAVGESDHDDGRGEREAGGGEETAKKASALQAESEDDLAAGGAGEELAEGDEVSVMGVVEPAALLDEFGTEIAEVRDRAAEAD